MLQDLAKKYPKGSNKFLMWINTNWKNKYVSDITHIWRNQTSSVEIVSDYELNGLLTEFFDEQKIILKSNWIFTETWRGKFEYRIFVVPEDEQEVYCTNLYKKRQDAFEEAVPKCFEILERQLVEEKK